MDQWEVAENIEELKFLFTKLPPKLPQSADGKKDGKSEERKIKNDLRKKEFKSFRDICIKKLIIFPIFFIVSYSLPVSYYSGFKALFTNYKHKMKRSH